MINSNTQIGSVDFEIDLHDKEFKLNVGLSVNNKILEMIQPLIAAGLKFESNKLIGKAKVQKALDEIELLEIEVRKARLLEQLRDLNK